MKLVVRVVSPGGDHHPPLEPHEVQFHHLSLLKHNLGSTYFGPRGFILTDGMGWDGWSTHFSVLLWSVPPLIWQTLVSA